MIAASAAGFFSLTKKIAANENWDRYINSCNVLRLVMTDFIRGSRNVDESLRYMQEEVVQELQEKYPDAQNGTRNDLVTFMRRIYLQEKDMFVVVIDEWDAFFRVWPDRYEEHEHYLNFLRDLLKDQEYLALAYMTGILPVKKYGVHSALNMFREFSMINPQYFAEYTGFTEDEVYDLCVRYGRSFDVIKEWYDGYAATGVIPSDPGYIRQSKTGESPVPPQFALYSPVSVIESVTTGLIRNYWNQTETFEALKTYIDRNFDGLKEMIAALMKGDRRSIDITTYQNDMTTFHSRDDVLTLLIHLGYLGYDALTGEVFIPNREVLDEFKSSTKTSEWTASFRALEESQ